MSGPQNGIETLIATAEHDNVFNKLESDNLLYYNGVLLHFRTTHFELDKAKRLINIAKTKSAYVALLTARSQKTIADAVIDHNPPLRKDLNC